MQKKIFNVLFIAVFASMLGAGIIAPLMPIYAESLGATGIWLGVIFLGFALARAIFMPLVGRISDRSSRKRFILWGLLGYTCISLLYLLAESVYSLAAIRFLHGFASAFVVPIAIAYVGETRTEGTEGVSMGTFNISLFLGMGMGPVLGGLINDVFGMDFVFYAMAGIAFLTFFLILFMLPEKVSAGKVKEAPSFNALWQNRVVKGLMFFRVALGAGRAGMMAFLPILASGLNVSIFQIGLLFSVDTFMIVLLQRPFGKLADKYNKFNFIMVGMIIGASGLLLIPFAACFRDLILISVLMGASIAVSSPSSTAIAVSLGKRLGMGTLMGSLTTAMSVGMVFSALILGVVMDVLDVEAVFYVAGLMGFLGVLAFYYFIRQENLPGENK